MWKQRSIHENEINNCHILLHLATPNFPIQMFVKPAENWDYDLDQKIQEIVKSGKVQLLERRVTPEYYPGLNGVFHVMKKM